MAQSRVVLAGDEQSLPAEVSVEDCLETLTSARPGLTVEVCETPEALQSTLETGIDCLLTSTDALTDWLDTFRTVTDDHDVPVLVFTASATDSIPASVVSGQVTCLPPTAEANPMDALAGHVTDLLESGHDDAATSVADEAGVDCRRLIESLADPVYMLDTDGYLRMVNEALTEVSGRSREEMLGTHVGDFIADADVEEGVELLAELRADDARSSATYEMTIIRGDGTRRVHENHLSVLEDADGTFIGSVGIIRDIQDRKERERELEQYETIIETVPEGVVVTDEETRIVGGNEQAAALVGLEYEEMLGTRIADLIADGIVGEGAVEHYDELVPELLSSDTDRRAATYEFTVSPVGTDETRVVRESLALRPYDGEFRGTIGVVRDVTERKRRLEELEQFETLVQAVPDTLFATDDQGNMTFVNEAGLERFNYASEEIEASEVHFSETVTDEDVEKFYEATRRRLAGEYDTDEKAVIEYTAVTSDGRRFPAEAHYALMPPSDEGAAGAGIVRDITERKQQEQQLQVLNRVLRHNLRNDLSVIFGCTESLAGRLRNEYGDEEGASIAEKARTRGQQLVEMSEEIRQIQTALERERLDRPTLDLVDVVDRLVDTFRDTYPGATIETDLPERALVEADRSLELAVENLVENAIVHNDADTPQVTVAVAEGDSDRGDWFELTVSDDGPGIPEQEQAVVEENATVTPLQHASGIGLWAVAWIVHSFDGGVTIDSDADGSTVAIRLRAAE